MPPRFRSLPELLHHRIQSTPLNPAYLFPEGEAWKTVSWAAFGEQVKALAMGLRALGLQEGEHCAIQAPTCYAWVLSAVAVSCAAGVTTTIYPTATWEEALHILKDADIRILFVDNEERLSQLRAHQAELPNLKHVICFEGQPSADGWSLPLQHISSLGISASQADYERVWQSLEPSSLATIIYTSGSTGVPKGVELTHDCWLYEAEGIGQLNVIRPEDIQLLWLPLSHVFGKLFGLIQFRLGFATAIDGRVEKILDNMASIRPTFSQAVPRIFEKIRNKIIQNAKQGGALKYKILKWAIRIGKKVNSTPKVGPLLAIQHALARKLVLDKIRALFGGRIRFIISGGAPLAPEVAEFFHACGILILEGYGLTETSAASFVNVPSNFKFGTVGPPIPGTEVKISEDGEILIKNRGVMRAYHKQPEATAQALEEGWLHTGDMGKWVEGKLQIVDRKKELIKTSGGKYIAPQHLENSLKTCCPYINQVLIHGNNRNFCSALITLDMEAIQRWASQNSISKPELKVHHPKIIELIGFYINRFNKTLAHFETIKKFHILENEFSIAQGELTPSLKLKRKYIEQKYQDILDHFYSGNVLSAD
ncbi:MAG: long-chain fatty acid--CoA ligase [Cystobacterineae bacterium]|nr:long-chain fatty acid--CoA ligase [Cystobacterineae bacterium]